MLIDHTPFKQIQIKTSKDAVDVLNTLHSKLGEFDREKECLYLIGITRRCTIKYIDLVSIGSISGTVAEPREIFRMAIHKAACRIIMAHNHPSGNLNPSEADNKLTKRIKEAGKIIDIELIDHIIFTDEGFYSYANEGCL